MFKLKNDLSSVSLFSVLFIAASQQRTRSAGRQLPPLALKNNGNKKRRGRLSLALIPKIRPSHCPYIKDKQLKSAHAIENIYVYATTQHTLRVHIRKDSTPISLEYTLLYI